jgi:DNA-binding NarL/FixJ family response regulator
LKRFLIIDDHEVVRSGVASVIKNDYLICEIKEASNEEEAWSILKKNEFDLAILHIHMPGSDALAFTEKIKTFYPDTKVLIFSMGAEHIYAKRFLNAGASGFVPKDSGLAELRKGIQLSLENKKYISENLASLLVDSLQLKQKVNPFENLSARELEVLALLVKGNTVTGISNSLNLSLSSANTYKRRIFQKLNINNLVDLIQLANLHKMI